MTGGETFVSKFENVLDVTRENLISEADLIERIRRMFDEGNLPKLIRVNTKQMLEILWVSSNFERKIRDNGEYIHFYDSPFGYIETIVIPAKELNENT